MEEKPVLFVDYLQILEPTNVVAASLNRSGYSEEVNFQSLKESGALEYTGDIVIGLQFQATAKIIEKSKNVLERTKKLTEERNKPIRKMEAVILKHRNGKIGSRAYFDYVPKYNLYREGEPDKNLMSSIQLALLEDDAETPEEFIEHKIVRRRVIK